MSKVAAGVNATQRLMKHTTKPLSLNYTGVSGKIRDELRKIGMVNDRWLLNEFEEPVFDLFEKFDKEKMVFLDPYGKDPMKEMGISRCQWLISRPGKDHSDERSASFVLQRKRGS